MTLLTYWWLRVCTIIILFLYTLLYYDLLRNKNKLKNQKEKNDMTLHTCRRRGERDAWGKATCKHRSKKIAGP